MYVAPRVASTRDVFNHREGHRLSKVYMMMELIFFSRFSSFLLYFLQYK